MRESQSMVVYSLPEVLDDLYRQFGFWKVSRALVAACMRRAWPGNRLSDLTNYMRRDIGVPEVTETDHERAVQFRRFL